ncbi:MAG: gliding motility-associated ABC transporter ATP-binding subunit GldA [Bacteroidales bacterium]
MSIEVIGVSKLYGEQKALDDVSMKLENGEIAGLLGPNGAGKSTLMKIITCFIPPDSGSVSVSGYDILEDAMEVRKSVGYLPEHNPLYLDMYVHEFLQFIAGLHKLPGNRKKRVQEMIEMTGLQFEQHKKIGALSKGFRQRVGLAQAMIHDPEVLILDEPTSGLDPNQLVEIRNLIKAMGKEKTVLFSTHIMQEVEALCSRVIIIDQGKIVADKPIGQLSAITSGVEILSVEFDRSTDLKKLRAIPGVTSVKSIRDKVWQIESAPDQDIRAAIFKFAVDEGLKVLTINRSQRSLEEVFQMLTKR